MVQNVRVGSSKTVHNALAVRIDLGKQIAPGKWETVRVAVPTCSVATANKELRYTSDDVTCKTCKKRVS